jgi:uncharacterized protein YfaT (DUF1175 family)
LGTNLRNFERGVRWAEIMLRDCAPQDRWYYQGIAGRARKCAAEIAERHPEWFLSVEDIE